MAPLEVVSALDRLELIKREKMIRMEAAAMERTEKKAMAAGVSGQGRRGSRVAVAEAPIVR